MPEFRPGDVVFFAGQADPVTVVKSVHIWNGSDGSYPGYEVVMEGWPGPERRGSMQFLAIEDNLELIEARLAVALDRVESSVAEVMLLRDRRKRLLEWKDRQGG